MFNWLRRRKNKNQDSMDAVITRRDLLGNDLDAAKLASRVKALEEELRFAKLSSADRLRDAAAQLRAVKEQQDWRKDVERRLQELSNFNAGSKPVYPAKPEPGRRFRTGDHIACGVGKKIGGPVLGHVYVVSHTGFLNSDWKIPVVHIYGLVNPDVTDGGKDLGWLESRFDLVERPGA